MAPNARLWLLVAHLLAAATAYCPAHVAPPLLRPLAARSSFTRRQHTQPAAVVGAARLDEAQAPSQGRSSGRPWLRLLPMLLAPPLLLRRALAMGGAGAAAAGPVVPITRSALLTRFALWFTLFTMAALLAGAETALTTLWPWKIKQIAADEGPTSAFAPLQENLTGVLTSLLVAVTFCMVYQTALATEIALQLGVSLTYTTIGLTLVTLVFGEVLPKSLAVANAERVARLTMPLISFVAFTLKPLGYGMSVVNGWLLRACGVAESEDTAVSQPELRLMIEGSKESGAVEDYEQDMIEGVLDLERTKVDLQQRSNPP